MGVHGMTHDGAKSDGPLVTVLVPTFNRRRYLAEALRSLVHQTYTNFEAFVVNDGGEPIGDLVESLGDPRLVLIERRENRGKAASLNEGLERAAGKYVAYLDDDDRYYPHHLERLVAALEGPTDCGAAYTDLYKVHCRVLEDGTRQVLGKVVNVSRDFDRFFLCYFNLAMHVSLMHRRELLVRTGLYDESLEVMIDWDMTRRLGFFTDFLHLPEVTGEFFGPVGECDRISYRMRLDRQRYLANLLRIRTARPAKPWPRMPDLSIILVPDRMGRSAADLIRQVYAWTFMPYQVYLPLPASELARLESDMPNLVRVPVPQGAGFDARIDAALARVEGDCVGIVPPEIGFGPLWIEDALHAAVHDRGRRTAFTLAGHTPQRPALVAPTETVRRARACAPCVGLLESLRDAGVAVREPTAKERALTFDRCLQDAEALQRDGNWVQAATLYNRIGERLGNRRWMSEREARALLRAGTRDADAGRVLRGINATQPTVSSLLMEARLAKRADRLDKAIRLLQRADRVLVGEEVACNS